MKRTTKDAIRFNALGKQRIISKPIKRLEALGWEEAFHGEISWEWHKGTSTLIYNYNTCRWDHYYTGKNVF